MKTFKVVVATAVALMFIGCAGTQEPVPGKLAEMAKNPTPSQIQSQMANGRMGETSVNPSNPFIKQSSF